MRLPLDETAVATPFGPVQSIVRRVAALGERYAAAREAAVAADARGRRPEFLFQLPGESRPTTASAGRWLEELLPAVGVVAQRLVRTLCPHCKKPAEITQDQWKSLVAPMRPRRPARVFAPVGCDECRHTGYLGRIGIYEVMRIDDDLRRMITADTDNRRMRDAALAAGMLPRDRASATMAVVTSMVVCQMSSGSCSTQPSAGKC